MHRHWRGGVLSSPVCTTTMQTRWASDTTWRRSCARRGSSWPKAYTVATRESQCTRYCSTTRRYLTIQSRDRYNKGWWVTRICWFSFIKEERNGERAYELKSIGSGRDAGTVYNVNALIRSLGTKKITLVYDRRAKLYRLPQSLDDYIERYGALSS